MRSRRIGRARTLKDGGVASDGTDKLRGEQPEWNDWTMFSPGGSFRQKIA